MMLIESYEDDYYDIDDEDPDPWSSGPSGLPDPSHPFYLTQMMLINDHLNAFLALYGREA